MVNLMKRSLVSVVRLSKCFGLFPFNLTQSGVVVSIPFIIIAIIIHLLLLCASIIAITLPARDVEVNAIYDALMNLQIATLESASIVHFIWLLLCRKKIEEVFQFLLNLETIQPINKKIIFKYPRMCYIFLLLVFMASFFMEGYANGGIIDIIDITVFFAQPALLFTAIFQFTGLLSICRNCFRTMTLALKKPYYLAENIEYAIDSFDQLVTCCETINYCYGPLLLLALVSLFVIMTSCFYVCYLVWSSRFIVVICGFWACFFLNTARYLAHSCWKTVITADQFYITLYKAIIKDRSLADNNHYKFVLDFVNKRELKFTAFGYFSIDYGMICSMVGTSATYLIILIQFSKEEENKSTISDDHSMWFPHSVSNSNFTTEIYTDSSTDFNYSIY